ncbi:ABC-2 type transport system permease protein [Actinoplanes lutulentus]|uniref:ABC-2 type transport system permease protein n=1 Tax=Actinoplanes lutulentus TaxID=1287878 RepID=A0A327ZHR9_9ACTN|nr:ABC transporter permease [Actinoplanes lutulentus]MBB2945515.1 ABC-2 type transport system permease protein [Actinoplanes lutulentus]RAK40353.1 ABC-2 type transport system permease protein [Actinoplanes lutulentus]
MSETGVIHDIGYQRYEGPRLGRGAAVLALYVHGLRASFGFGRSAKAKIFPWMVAGIMLLVAVILAAVRSQTGQTIFTYVQFDDQMAWLIIFFVAILGPELMSRDIGSNTLPLYFSRPLRAADYVAAKFAAMVTAVWLLLGVPQLIMFLGAAFTTDDGAKGVWNEFLDLAPGWGYSLLWALLFSSIGLLVASLTGKRAFAAGGIVAIFLLTTPIVVVLSVLPSSAANHMAGLASPMSLIAGVGQWLSNEPESMSGLDLGRFGPIYGIEAVCLIAACLLLLLARYRKVAAL